MSRLAGLSVLVLSAFGCATVHTDVRTERGELLRTFGREVPLDERGVSATVEPSWPKVTLALSQYQTCRAEEVEVYSEDVVTERTAPHAAPAIAAGASQAALGAILFLARGAFSNEPNKTLLDAQGRYGASSRQVAVGWSIALAGIGVPAVVAGLVELSMVGEKRAKRESEQVATVREVPCQLRPIDGELEFISLRSPDSLLVRTTGGRATLGSEQLAKVAFDSFTLDGKLVQLDAGEREKLDAFEACIHLEAQKSRLEELPVPELKVALLQARACAPTPGAQPEIERINALLEERQRPPPPVGASAPGGEAPER